MPLSNLSSIVSFLLRSKLVYLSIWFKSSILCICIIADKFTIDIFYRTHMIIVLASLTWEMITITSKNPFIIFIRTYEHISVKRWYGFPLSIWPGAYWVHVSINEYNGRVELNDFHGAIKINTSLKFIAYLPFCTFPAWQFLCNGIASKSVTSRLTFPRRLIRSG